MDFATPLALIILAVIIIAGARRYADDHRPRAMKVASVWGYSDGGKRRYRWLCTEDGAGEDNFVSADAAIDDARACGYYVEEG